MTPPTFATPQNPRALKFPNFEAPTCGFLLAPLVMIWGTPTRPKKNSPGLAAGAGNGPHLSHGHLPCAADHAELADAADWTFVAWTFPK